MKLNKAPVSTVSVTPLVTHEGAPASRTSAELSLRRSVLSTMLWEDSFYESGEDCEENLLLS